MGRITVVLTVVAFVIALTLSITFLCRSPRSAPAPSPKPEAVDASLEGELRIVGASNMVDLLQCWAEEFAKIHPSVKVQIEGSSSSAAPTALLAGTGDIGPMSRVMKAAEVDAFIKKFGHEPARVRCTVDALAVIVHKDNPLKGLSIARLDAIFSRTRRRGGEEIHTWDRLGLAGEWAGKPIRLCGRISAMSSHVFFKERVLKNGDYGSEMEEFVRSADVVRAVGTDRFAIGYLNLAQVAPDEVRAIPLSEEEGGGLVMATAASVWDGSYPLARPFFLYFNPSPGKPLDPPLFAFIQFALSERGQTIVEKVGHIPLPLILLDVERKKIGKIAVR
jgi:phosphate transport system substrate-binding protein